jgi:hypothetical protein
MVIFWIVPRIVIPVGIGLVVAAVAAFQVFA